LFLDEELNKFQALSGRKIAKRVKMLISFFFLVIEQNNVYQSLNQRWRFFPYRSKREWTKNCRSPCRYLSPASPGVKWHPQPYPSRVTQSNQEHDCRIGILSGVMGASEDCHPPQISVPLCLHCCCEQSGKQKE